MMISSVTPTAMTPNFGSSQPCLRSYALAAIAAQVPSQSQSPEVSFLRQHLFAVTRHGASWLESLEHYWLHPHPQDQPLLQLRNQLLLTCLELLTVALAAGVEDDAHIGRAIAQVQAPLGGSRPTLGLLAAAFAETAKPASPIQVLVNGNAMQTGLLALSDTGDPLPEQVISLPTHLGFALQGADSVYPGTTLGLEPQSSVRLPPSILTMAAHHARGLQAKTQRTLLLRAGSVMEGRSVAAAIAQALQRRPLFIQTEAVTGLGPWLRLRDLLPVFCFALAPGESRELPTIPGYDGSIVVLCGRDGSVDTPGGATLSWTIPLPTRPERIDLWELAISDRTLATELAHHHRHSSGRIAQLGTLAQHRHQLANNGLSSSKTPLTVEDIAAVAWCGEGVSLETLAQPLPAQISDRALKMSEPLYEALNLLRLRCQSRDGLVDGLGASAQARYYPGVRALFVGSSGTGKTLAAGWLATQLQMPLYRVDLAAVSSKYIGETEKNLAQLLTRAEQDEMILLFDEADSLFGKRTDIQQANDRFANAQTNYLLQRIETFDGIAILTSNSRNRFDAAFTRRLDAVIEFPLPNPQQRKALWKSHLGTPCPLRDKDLNQLATLTDLNGGDIRNVVLTAAVIAQSRDGKLRFSDVVQGLAAEYRKLGRQMPLTLQ
ncbi:ATP-binding protein [Leptolyngbya sp. AN02str]|uniref:ATP-binding protein n=1 Tax=Leptolyngbya sp. AN02str TaxID=3423363 RepID=UPI003D31F381